MPKRLSKCWLGGGGFGDPNLATGHFDETQMGAEMQKKMSGSWEQTLVWLRSDGAGGCFFIPSPC